MLVTKQTGQPYIRLARSFVQQRERRGSTRNVEYQPALRTSLDQFPLVNPIDLGLLEVEGDSCSIE